MKKKLVLFCAIMFFVLLAVKPALAEGPAQPELSLNDAVARALTFSEAVKKADKEINRTRALRDQIQLEIGFIPTGAVGNAVEAQFYNLFSANLTWEVSKKSLTVEQDKVALDACNKYWAVQQTLGALEVAEQELKQAKLDLDNARLFQKVGLISQDALLAAETKYIATKSALEKAKNELETAYTAFNQLVGLEPEDRPVLTDELNYSPLTETNLDFLVTKVLENSPSVWQANKMVELQEILNEMAFYTGTYQPYEARKIKLNQTRLDAVSAREATEILTRTIYYSVRTLEDNYPAAEQAVKLAEENLRVGQVKYQVGTATRADVVALETALVKARQSLLELKKNHAYLKLVLEKPWAYNAGSLVQ